MAHLDLEGAPDHIFNGKDRAATAELFGYALYGGTIEDGVYCRGRYVCHYGR